MIYMFIAIIVVIYNIFIRCFRLETECLSECMVFNI